jgi:hypothetical protein
MTNEYGTTIYIEENSTKEAEFMSRNFVNPAIKNRAYINTLGAELVIKYLKSEGIHTDDLHNIHSISKFLEDFDISDIILPNIHLDVRVVFDKKQIFIPKSHFDFGLTPDVYVVLVLAQDFKNCEMIGYFTPDKIDRKNENSQYYFISENKLSSPDTLSKFVKDFSRRISEKISDAQILKGRELSLKLADHNIPEDEEKELIKLLISSSVLRESIIEFDNFETLAYNASKEMVKEEPVQEEVVLEEEPTVLTEDSFEGFDNDDDLFDLESQEQEEPQEENTEESSDFENCDENLEENFENLDLDSTTLDMEDIVLDENALDELPQAEDNSEDNNIIGDIATGALAAGTIATGAMASQANVQSALTDEVIKLAGVAGDVVSEGLEQAVNTKDESDDYVESFENLKETVLPVETETLENEDIEITKDMSELKQVEVKVADEVEDFQEDAINLEDLDSVEVDTLEQNTDNLSDFSDIDADFSKESEELPEITNQEDVIDLSELPETDPQIVEPTEDFDEFQEFDNKTENEEENVDSLDTIQEEGENLESPVDELDKVDEFDKVEELDEFGEFDEIKELDEVENTQEEENLQENVEEIQDLSEEVSEDESFEEVPVEVDETVIETVPVALENSKVISDKDFQVGEIPIDINIQQQPNFEDSDSLESLYAEDSEMEPSMLKTPGRTGKATYNDKKNLGLVTGLIVLAFVCTIGFGVAKLFKAPKDETPEPTTNDTLTEKDVAPTQDNQEVNPDNVLKMDNNTDMLADVKKDETVAKSVPTNNVATTTKSAISATAYPEVKKLTWEVPDYISYYPQFKNYFQTVGKSLKLSLSSDLLLATDFVYSKEVKVSITFNKDGSFKNAQVFKSSGSSQIDKIVLQTVNQTLNVLKAPSSVGNDESTTVVLKIYF